MARLICHANGFLFFFVDSEEKRKIWNDFSFLSVLEAKLTYLYDKKTDDDDEFGIFNQFKRMSGFLVVRWRRNETEAEISVLVHFT